MLNPVSVLAARHLFPCLSLIVRDFLNLIMRFNSRIVWIFSSTTSFLIVNFSFVIYIILYLSFFQCSILFKLNWSSFIYFLCCRRQEIHATIMLHFPLNILSFSCYSLAVYLNFTMECTIEKWNKEKILKGKVEMSFLLCVIHLWELGLCFLWWVELLLSLTIFYFVHVFVNFIASVFLLFKCFC